MNKMNISRRGTSVAAIVVGLVVVAALVVGGIYYFSARGRQQLRSAWGNFSEWTPENISKDPTGYLNFCEEQTKNAQKKLDESKIAIALSKNRFENARDEAKRLQDAGNRALTELKAAYVDANDKNAWPLKWSAQAFEKEQAKKQIVRFDKETRAKAKMVQTYSDGIKQLETQASKVQDAKDKANEQLTTIQTSREQLKVKAITDDLTKQLVDMKGVLQTSVIGVAQDTSSTLSLEDLTAKTDSTVSDEDFNKVMGGK